MHRKKEDRSPDIPPSSDHADHNGSIASNSSAMVVRVPAAFLVAAEDGDIVTLVVVALASTAVAVLVDSVVDDRCRHASRGCRLHEIYVSPFFHHLNLPDHRRISIYD